MDPVALDRKLAEQAARFFTRPGRVHGVDTQSRRQPPQPIPDIVTVRNALGRNLTQYSAVLIGNPIPSALGTGPADTYALINPSLRGQRAGFNADEPIIGILLSDIADGSTGAAQIAGVVPAAFRYDETGGSVASAWADISDLDDKLTFGNFGPIRVLQRAPTVNAGSASKVWMVELGTASSLGSVDWFSDQFTFSDTVNTNYGNIWSLKYGDAIRVGLHQVGSTTALRLGRVGRYFINVEWLFLPNATFTGLDRCSYQVTWSDLGFTNSQIRDYGDFTPGIHVVANGMGWQCGQRSFTAYINSDAPSPIIPIPGIHVSKISGSTATTITDVAGALHVHVIKLGAGYFDTVWSESARNTAWSRSSTDGPVP